MDEITTDGDDPVRFCGFKVHCIVPCRPTDVTSRAEIVFGHRDEAWHHDGRTMLELHSVKGGLPATLSQGRCLIDSIVSNLQQSLG